MRMCFNLFLLLLVTCICLQGCGKNLFGEFPEKKPDNLADQLSEADTVEEYTEIVVETFRLLENYDVSDPASNTNITPEEAQETFEVQGNSIMAATGVNTLDIFQDVLKASEEEEADPGSTDTDSLLAEMEDTVNSYDTNSLAAAAHSLNQADTLSTTTSNELDSDADLSRGMANLLAMSGKVMSKYSFESDGTIIPITRGVNRDNLIYLMTTQENVTVTLDDGTIFTVDLEEVTQYSEEAIEAFTNAECLSDDQLSLIDNAEEAMEKAESLYNTMLNDGTFSIVVNGQTQTFNTANDDEIRQALEAIFESIST